MKLNRSTLFFIAAVIVLLGALIIRGSGNSPRTISQEPVSAIHAAATSAPAAAELTASAYGLHLPPRGKKVLAPAGRQVYEISQQAGTLPTIAETVIDPPAVHVGDMQHLEVLVSSPSEITKVYAVSRLDSKEVKVPLQFVKDEMRAGQTYQRFAADWKVEDTHDLLYMTAFFAEDSAGHVNHVEHAWSDACGIPCSGGFTLPFSCTISATDGVTSGNFALGSGVTLTLNAAFYYNSGYNITFSGGAIAIGSGGSIHKGAFTSPDCGAPPPQSCCYSCPQDMGSYGICVCQEYTNSDGNCVPPAPGGVCWRTCGGVACYC